MTIPWGCGRRVERGPRGARSAGAVVLLCLTAGVATAGEPDIWRFQCISEEPKSNAVCTTELETSTENGDFVIYFVHNPKDGSPLVVAGEEQDFAETVIKVDKKDPIAADHCEVGLCYYDLEKSAVLLKQFRRGGRARVTVTAEGLKVILDKTITLRGFTAAFAQFKS